MYYVCLVYVKLLTLHLKSGQAEEIAKQANNRAILRDVMIVALVSNRNQYWIEFLC